MIRRLVFALAVLPDPASAAIWASPAIEPRGSLLDTAEAASRETHRTAGALAPLWRVQAELAGDGQAPPAVVPGFAVAPALRQDVEAPQGEAEPPGVSTSDATAVAREAPPLPLPQSVEDWQPDLRAAPLSGAALLNELAEGIARATTQGALNLAPGTGEHARGLPAPGTAVPSAANIRLRLPGEEAWRPAESPPDTRCPPESVFDVAASVPEDLDPAEAIAAQRERLAQDIDTVDEEGALALARLYVGLGFGAEARATIEAMAPRQAEAALLSAMSLIVDGQSPSPGAFDAVRTCAGRAQLWVTLASRSPGTPGDVATAFSELPIALRRHVGPWLIEIFLKSGDAATAETIRAAVERAAGPHGATFDLAAARIDLGREEPSGLETIRGIAESPSPASDDALALLLEAADESGEVVDASAVARASARADDLRGTADGLRLETGLIRAHLRRDEFDEAAARLRSSDLTSAAAASLAGTFFAALAARGPDGTVLIHGTGFAGDLSELVRNTPAGLAMSARLLDLGLPDVARSYLPGSPTDATALTLLARSLLVSGDPAGALGILGRIEAPARDQLRLRADILWSLGQRDEAEGLRAALDVADGEDVRAHEAPPAVVSAAQDGGAASPREIVVASEEVRREIDALLSAAPAP